MITFSGKRIYFKVEHGWSSSGAVLFCIQKWGSEFLLLEIWIWYVNSYENLREIKSRHCRHCNLFWAPVCCFEIRTPNKYCCGSRQDLKSWVLAWKSPCQTSQAQSSLNFSASADCLWLHLFTSWPGLGCFLAGGIFIMVDRSSKIDWANSRAERYE